MSCGWVWMRSEWGEGGLTDRVGRDALAILGPGTTQLELETRVGFAVWE